MDQYEAACKVRRLAARTIPTYKRWVVVFCDFTMIEQADRFIPRRWVSRKWKRF